MQANAVTYSNVVTQYAIAVDAGLGNVGIGTLTPDSHAILDVTPLL
jgi:hypothetical protein